MLDLEKIKEVRAKQKADKEQKDKATAEAEQASKLVGSVNQGAKMTTLATSAASKKSADTIKEELKTSGEKIVEAFKEEQSGVASALNNLVLATVIAKDPEILDTAKNLADLLKEISLASADFKQSKLNQLPEANDKLAKTIDKLASNVKRDPSKDYTKEFESVSEQLKKLVDKEYNPVFKVPPTKIPPLDVTPIAQAIENSKTTKEDNLSEYKAQDLTGDDTFQYVGFVAPNGNWYIIENDINGGSMRYKFGLKSYATNWENHTGLSYKLLNEAIREIKT